MNEVPLYGPSKQKRHAAGPRWVTGVPRPYEKAPYQDATVGIFLGPYGGPREGGSFL
jgi:hypothetical protein